MPKNVQQRQALLITQNLVWVMILITDSVDFWESVGFKATDNRDNNGQPDLFVAAIKFKTEMNPFRPIGFNLLYFLVFFTTPTETNFRSFFYPENFEQ